jgi:hypothetical protein
MRRFCLALIAPLAIGLLAACSGSATAPGGLSSNAGALPPVGSAAHKRTLPSQLLFVPTETGTIDIDPLQHPNQGGVIAQITGLKAFQQQMAVDASNDLFVVNNGASADDDYVSEYAPPYDGTPTILSTTYSGFLYYPVGVAVDAGGTAYVSDCGQYCLETPGILVYPPGSTSPTKMITSPSFNSLGGLTVDSHGDLYAFNWNANTFACDVFKLKGASGAPKAMHLKGLDTGNGGNGLSFNGSGDLYVAANSSGSNYILEYKPGSHTAFRVIDSMPFTDEPTMLDVGPDGNLYTATSCSFGPCTWVYAFKSKGKKPFESIGSSPYNAAILGVVTAPNLRLKGSKR